MKKKHESNFEAQREKQAVHTWDWCSTTFQIEDRRLESLGRKGGEVNANIILYTPTKTSKVKFSFLLEPRSSCVSYLVTPNQYS